MKLPFRKEPSEYDKKIKAEFQEAKRKAFEEEHRRLALEKAEREGKRIAKERVEGSNASAEKLLKPFAYFAKGVGKTITESKPQKHEKSDTRIVGENFAAFVSGDEEVERHRDRRYKKKEIQEKLRDEFLDDEEYDSRLVRKMKKNGVKNMDDLL
jgi:hypothetical protein